MRSIALIIAILGFSTACKSSVEKSAAKNKKLATPAAIVANDEDDGAIDIPKELHSTVFLDSNAKASSARVPIVRDGLPREFAAGSKLQVKLRAVKNLKLGLISASAGGKLTLGVEGSSLTSLEFEGGEKEFVIPMKGIESETLVVILPRSARSSLSITQLSALGGEIIEWTVLAP